MPDDLVAEPGPADTDEVVEPEDTVEAGEAEPATPRPKRSAATVVLGILALVLLLTTVLLAVVAADLKQDKDDLADDRDEVAEAATRLVEAVFSYDHADIDGSLYDGLDAATGPLATQIEEGLSSQEEAITAAESTAVVTVEDVFVADVEAESASVIVQMDVTRTGTAGAREERNIYLRLGMVRLEGGWKASELVNLNLASLLSNPQDEASTTTVPG